jgi:hypothetical protein
MKEYLVLDYTDTKTPYKVVKEKELMKILDEHRNELLKQEGQPHKIAVYEVGELILDWS